MQNSDLKQKLDLLKSYSVIYDGANIKDTIDTLEDRIEQNEFKIAVVGEFSAGKSTFINSIVGKDLLKHATLETTAALTYIHNVKPDDSRVGTCCITFSDGSVENLDKLSDLEKYTTTQSPIDVVSEVRSVDIYIDFIDVEDEKWPITKSAPSMFVWIH